MLTCIKLSKTESIAYTYRYRLTQKKNMTPISAHISLHDFLIFLTIYLIESSLFWYSLYYAKACNEFAGLINVPLRPGNTDPFKEILQRRRQHRFQFKRGEIWSLDLPLQGQMR